jgi:hypothetical protein
MISSQIQHAVTDFDEIVEEASGEPVPRLRRSSLETKTRYKQKLLGRGSTPTNADI